MIILQKDLKLFRFANQKPHPDYCPKKYEYQLFNKTDLLAVEHSDNEFRMGLITIGPEVNKTRLQLIDNSGEIDHLDLEDTNTFLLPVTESK